MLRQKVHEDNNGECGEPWEYVGVIVGSADSVIKLEVKVPEVFETAGGVRGDFKGVAIAEIVRKKVWIQSKTGCYD